MHALRKGVYGHSYGGADFLHEESNSQWQKQFGEMTAGTKILRRTEMKYNEELVQRLVDIYNKSERRINVLDFALMDENAHTKFLKAILCHERNGKQVFVQSFLRRMLDQDVNDFKFIIEDQVTIDGGRILDLRLKSRDLYVVIENKVKCAKDGDRQMADYLHHCKAEAKKTHAEPRLIYLTLAGGAPAKWSLDEENHDKVKGENWYFERSYRDEILGWLREDVLPNCLQSENSLFHSLSIYVDILARMTGGMVDGIVAKKAHERLVKYGISDYGDVSALCEAMVQWMENRKLKEFLPMIEHACEVVTTLRDWLIHKCVYLDSSWAAYNLKWILKNNPTVEYKNRGSFYVGAFASVSQFTYCGKKFVGLATNASQCGMKIEIHINCEPDGFKDGPYVFPEILKLGVTEAELLANGFRPSIKWGNKFHFPMDDFDKEKTGLEDVARHIESMIRKLERLAPKLRWR